MSNAEALSDHGSSMRVVQQSSLILSRLPPQITTQLFACAFNRAVKAGQHFGFPFYGGGKARTEEYKSATAPADVVFPQVEMAAHAADLGMTFYTGSKFPKKYQNAIFSAQHGSWNRTTPVGARVMVTYLKEDGTADKTEPFAEGWLNADEEYLGRPVDVAQLRDGSLLVSDDLSGALYRIWYEGR